MKLTAEIEGKTYVFDDLEYVDLSIPLQFNGDQPNSYNVAKAESKAYESDGFVGDTRRGGGCNFDFISLIPHCNGTHTECVGHITDDRFSIQRQLTDVLLPCTVITISPVDAGMIDDAYQPVLNSNDRVITRAIIQNEIDKRGAFSKALLIRTLPNDDSKKARSYIENPPPFFTLDAMKFIVDLEVKHLLVDLPSVDRTFDEGKLSAHHIFWNIHKESHNLNSGAALNNTITEMIYIPEEVQDGIYLLNLQIAPFVSDAAPSRPILYPLKTS